MLSGFQWLSFLTLLFAVVLTAVATPAVVGVFRRKVTESMARTAPEARSAAHGPQHSGGGLQTPSGYWHVDPGTVGGAAASWPPAGPPTIRWPLIRVSAGAALHADPKPEALVWHARHTRQRLAIAYGCGALGQAVTVTAVLVVGGRRYTALSIWVIALVVLSLPAVLTVAHVLALRPVERHVVFGGALVVAWIVTWAAGDAALGPLLFLLYGLVPATVFLLFNLRFWRGAAPLVLAVSTCAGLGWLVFVAIARVASVGGTAVWLFRLAGLGGGLLVGLAALRMVGRRYRDKRMSDQMIFVDVWWLLLTVLETAVATVAVGGAGLLSLTAFGVYLVISRALIGRVRSDLPPAARLLLLRVFGHDRRTERLLDELTLRWRPFGTVDLIAGRDLAVRNIDPSELYAFLTGGLAREFVGGPVDVLERLAHRDDRQDPDGRFRVNQFFCHQDTWQQMLDTLVVDCDAVLMDLRDFDDRRIGCRYEIGRLAAHVGEKPIVLLVNPATRLDLAERIFFDGVPAHRVPTECSGKVFVLEAERSDRKTVDTATTLLLGARPA